VLTDGMELGIVCLCVGRGPQRLLRLLTGVYAIL
jgi:hypothetical protein